MEVLERRLQKLVKLAKSGAKEAKAEDAVLQKIKAALDEGKTVRSVELTEDERDMIKEMNFLTMKPTLFVERAVRTRLELATPCVTGMYSNQLN